MWSEEDFEFMIDYYTIYSMDELGLFLGKSKWAIYKKAELMGLSRSRRGALDKIRNCYYCGSNITKLTKGGNPQWSINRSLNDNSIIGYLCDKCDKKLDYYSNREIYLEQRRFHMLDDNRRKWKSECTRLWYQRNKKRISDKGKRERLELKVEVMTYYCGDIPKCICCGESTIQFLSIDHINGGGLKHRKSLKIFGSGIYRWLKTNKYPDGYRVFCMNCNFGSAINGGICPHKASEL